MKRNDFNLLPGKSYPEVKITEESGEISKEFITDKIKKEPYFIVFDTETTGLPLNYKAPVEDLNNWPRVIQLAYSLFDKNHNLIKKVCTLIKPDGWVIPNEKFWIDNGYSQEKSLLEGTLFKEVLQEYIEDRLKCKYAIAHNINFDSKILRAEMFRYGFKQEFEGKKICTMMKSTNYCQIPNAKGNNTKWPNLTELHNHLFKAGFQGAHDAGADVEACAKCFFELINRKVIVLD